jgi:hypothetical protein
MTTLSTLHMGVTGTEMSSHLPKVTQLLRGGVFRTQGYLIPADALDHCAASLLKWEDFMVYW